MSYAQKNSQYADGIDLALQNLGYDVKRDIRDVDKWDSIREFMKTIRKEDYVVFLGHFTRNYTQTVKRAADNKQALCSRQGA